MPDIGRIERRILGGRPAEEAIGKFDWREFEEIVGEIFSRNDFLVKRNFRFRTGRRWENDLIAARGGSVFCVDCKRWSEGREKRWGLSKAAEEQEKRTRALESFIRSSPVASNAMGISDRRFVPMVVTLHQEGVLKEGRTYVVPAGKLNSFILASEQVI